MEGIESVKGIVPRYEHGKVTLHSNTQKIYRIDGENRIGESELCHIMNTQNGYYMVMLRKYTRIDGETGIGEEKNEHETVIIRQDS